MADDNTPSVSQSEKRLVWQDGAYSESTDVVANEVAVSLVYNGISHVVMMLTPTDLEFFALGFSLSEGILDSPQQLLDFEIEPHELGLQLQITITAEAFARLKTQRRNMTGRTGCGLCGAEALEQAIPQVPIVNSSIEISSSVIDGVLERLAEQQTIQNETGAVHAAAWCSLTGEVLLISEDVGRHNALDKVLGALASSGLAVEGFLVVTSRASYEMVLKAARANVSMLVAVSAPTSLAIELAEKSGVTLVCFARTGRHAIYTHVHRVGTN